MVPWGYQLMSQPATRKPRTSREFSRGSLMVEVVVAVVLFGLVGSAVLAGLSTAHTSGTRTKAQAVAENLARNQLEDIFSQPYLSPPASYGLISPPSGYGVTAIGEEYVTGDSNVSRIVVEVTRAGDSILVVETLRARE